VFAINTYADTPIRKSGAIMSRKKAPKSLNRKFIPYPALL